MKLTHTQNKEWGSKGRKIEESLRGLTHTDARRAIAEELATIVEARQAEAAEAAAEAAWHIEWAEQAFARRMDEEFSRMLDRDARFEAEADWTLEIDGYADLSDYATDIYAGTADEF